MKIGLLLIDKSLWTDEEIQIFKEFDYKCIACWIRDADTLHELIPKSLAPKTWKQPENRVPLCNKCHTEAHDHGTRKSRVYLEQQRNAFRQFLSG